MSNKYTYSVPFTTNQLAADYFAGMSQAEIAGKYAVTQHVVQRAMVKAGIPRRKQIKRNQRGSANATWKGGRPLMAVTGSGRFSDRGYHYIKKPEHPNADKRGYVAEHIDVATKCLGRPLVSGECVHHIDLTKHNNSADNLAVCTRKQHREYHLQLEMIAIELLRAGKVRFIPSHGYELC